FGLPAGHAVGREPFGEAADLARTEADIARPRLQHCFGDAAPTLRLADSNDSFVAHELDNGAGCAELDAKRPPQGVAHGNVNRGSPNVDDFHRGGESSYQLVVPQQLAVVT